MALKTSALPAGKYNLSTLSPSKRVGQMSISAIKEMEALAKSAPDCITLSLGCPVIPTPPFILEGIREEVTRNPELCRYSPTTGMLELRQEIARWYQRSAGVTLDPVRNIIVTTGGTEATATALFSLVGPGDEVIVPCPAYPSHIDQITMSGATAVFLPLREAEGWTLDLERLEASITDRTKAMFVCNPSNPTGSLLTREELLQIAALAERHDFYILTDESLDCLTYDVERPFSLISCWEDLSHRLIVTSSFSKRYALSGWRVGYAIVSDSLMPEFVKVHDSLTFCAPTMSQFAATLALRHTDGTGTPGDAFLRELTVFMDANRKILASAMEGLSDFFDSNVPKGGYSFFPRLRRNPWGRQFAYELLRHAGVATVPGSTFGPCYEDNIRIFYGGSTESIIEGMSRIDSFLRSRPV